MARQGPMKRHQQQRPRRKEVPPRETPMDNNVPPPFPGPTAATGRNLVGHACTLVRGSAYHPQ